MAGARDVATSANDRVLLLFRRSIVVMRRDSATDRFCSVVCICKPRYLQIRLGFARLQAIIRARQLVAHYNRLRYIVVQLQVV